MKIFMQALLIATCLFIAMPAHAEVEQLTTLETYDLYVQAAEEQITESLDKAIEGVVLLGNVLLSGELSFEMLNHVLAVIYNYLASLREYLRTVQIQLELLR